MGWQAAADIFGGTTVQPDTVTLDESTTMTIEAFADTILPGEKRSPDDRAVAGVSTGGGAVAAGAVELLLLPASGFAELITGLAPMLDAYATAYAEEHGRTLEDDVPAFVALSFDDRTALVQRLLAPDNPEKSVWVGLAMFSTMAFDSAAQMSTPDALASGHPGLLTIGYARPDPDRLWRFPQFSYGRPLSRIHPNTTSTGSPA